MTEHTHTADCYGEVDGRLLCGFDEPTAIPLTRTDQAIPVDRINEAIAATEPEAPTQMRGDTKFEDGQTMTLVVPYTFTAGMFETAIQVLLQMRMAVYEREQAKATLVVPSRPPLMGLDGKPLT